MAPSNPIKLAPVAVAPPLVAAPSVAALAEIVMAGNAVNTPSVKAGPGAVCSNAPSTKATTRSCNSFRPRDNRCRAASSDTSKMAATRLMD